MTGSNKVEFTAVYDWLAKRKDLNWNAKILIAHILRFGRSGCWKDNATLERDLGIHRANVERLINRLVHLEWIAALYDGKRERTLFINEQMLDEMPLFQNIKGCGKPVKRAVKSSVPEAGNCCAAQQTGPELLRSATSLYRNRKDLSSDERLRKEISALTGSMKERSLPTAAELERRRRRQRERLGL